MTIIVTGGSGLIGTNLIDYYAKKNFKIFNLDIKPPQKKEHKEYWHQVDLSNYDVLCKLVTKIKPKYIIHLAAKTDLSGKEYKDYAVNIKSVENIIKI